MKILFYFIILNLFSVVPSEAVNAPSVKGAEFNEVEGRFKIAWQAILNAVGKAISPADPAFTGTGVEGFVAAVEKQEHGYQSLVYRFSDNKFFVFTYRSPKKLLLLTLEFDQSQKPEELMIEVIRLIPITVKSVHPSQSIGYPISDQGLPVMSLINKCANQSN